MEPTASPSTSTPPRHLPIMANASEGVYLTNLIDALAAEHFLAGLEPFARTKSLTRVRPDATLLPPDVEPARELVDGKSVSRVASGDGWTISTWRGGDAQASLCVTARTDALAQEILAVAIEGACEPEPPEDVAVVMGFWHQANHGPRRNTRSIRAPQWSEIRANYAADVASAFDRLMALDRTDVTGRLMLMHGPPGTGKTTALRALARSWHAWCSVECIVDPERFLGNTGYLLDVVVADAEDDKRWRLLVLEDCDELIRQDAKAGTGQGLARLLNLTDGLLGDGAEILVCITTNEELDRLHPAIVRPGRCLARLYVDRLSRAEALAWLGHDVPRSSGPGSLSGVAVPHIPAEGATLAELCALRGDLTTVAHDEPTADVGLYL